MARSLSVTLLLLTIGVAHGQAPPPPEALPSNGPIGVDVSQGPFPAPPPPQDGPIVEVKPPSVADRLRAMNAEREAGQARDAGLPAASRPRILTLQEAYWLALLRSRSTQEVREVVPSPKDLAAEAGKAGFADFARFREVFLAKRGDGAASAFRDPSASFLDLLRRAQDLEACRKTLKTLENQSALEQAYTKGLEASPLSPQFDRTTRLLEQARSDVLDRVLAYRDALDAFKVELGLRADAEVVPDLSLLAPIHRAFDSIELWMGSEAQNFEELPGILDKLPKPADLTIDGLSLADCQKKGTWTAFFAAADKLLARSPLAKPGGAIDERDRARVRSRIRNLAQFTGKMPIDTSLYLLAVRQRAITVAQLIAPPASDPKGSLEETKKLSMSLMEQVGEAVHHKDRIVRDWAEGHAIRIGLYRDLGILPQADWDAYWKAF